MPKPNILFITTDQHALHAVGCYGAPLCRTPHIDGLAQHGVRFTRAYSPCALSAPARASLLCGLYPDHLRRQGYRLGYSGKWHAGIRRTAHDAGFEGYGPRGYGNPRHDAEYQDYLRLKGIERLDEVFEVYAEGERKYAGGDSSGYTNAPTGVTPTAFVADTAIALVERFAASSEPFFIHCSFWGPHAPYLPSLDYKDAYRPEDVPPWASFEDALDGKPLIHRKHRRCVFPGAAQAGWDVWAQVVARYYGFVTEIDQHIGRLLAALERLGVYDDTLIFFTTDHGETIGIHGGAFDKGAMAYEEVYHIPLVVKLPGNAQAGTPRDQRVSLLDLPATFCDAAGTAMDGTDGASLLPLLHDAAVPSREHFVAEFHRHRFPASQRIVWWGQYKYILNFADIGELYDLAADPAEMTNLIEEPSLKGVRDEMRSRLLAHMLETEDRQGPQWQYILERPFQP